MASETPAFDMQDALIADDEYATFCENLEKIQNKFFNDWIGSFKVNCERKLSDQYGVAISKCKDDIEKLLKQIEDQKERSIQMNEVSDRLRKLEALKLSLKQQLSEESKKLEDLTQKLEAETKDVESLEKVTMAKREKFAKALTFFKERLGLEFKNLKGEEQIKVVFTRIDEYDQGKEFSFRTTIVDSNYIISDCNPTVMELDALADELNTSNDFRRFIIKMRCAFKNTLIQCKENNPPSE